MAMVDLKLPKTEKGTLLAQAEPSEPEYPYGMCLHLDDDTLTKLGVQGLPTVGGEIRFTAVARVRSVNASEYEDDGKTEKRRSAELQVVAMDMAGAGETGDKAATIASRLYG